MYGEDKCDYCLGLKDVHELDDMPVELEVEGTYLTIRKFGFVFRIDYCPMCGRKLR